MIQDLPQAGSLGVLCEKERITKAFPISAQGEVTFLERQRDASVTLSR